MIKNIIFDVDGTILDTEHLVIQSLRQALNEFGADHSYEFCKKYFGMPSQDCVKHFDIREEDQEAFIQKWVSYEDVNLPKAEMFDDMMTVLKTLKNAGIKMGVVTSRLRQACDEDFLKKFSLEPYFISTITVDDCEKRKPHPQPLLKCLEQMGADKDESIFIGDSIFDMQCANDAGVKFALAVWGAGDVGNYNNVQCYLNEPEDILKLLVQ